MNDKQLTKNDLFVALGGLATKVDMENLTAKISSLTQEVKNLRDDLASMADLVEGIGDFVGDTVVGGVLEEHNKRIGRLERHTNHPPVSPRPDQSL